MPVKLDISPSQKKMIAAGSAFILLWYCIWYGVEYFQSTWTTNKSCKKGNIIDWSKLNLTSEQASQLTKLDQDWNHDYEQLSSLLKSHQDKFRQLIAIHDSNEIEIMALQEKIAQEGEQLSTLATKTYLKKRQLLNENQKHDLERMIKIALTKRQHPITSDGQYTVMPVQSLMQKVGGIWPVQEEEHQNN